jgi:hypothetical protein
MHGQNHFKFTCLDIYSTCSTEQKITQSSFLKKYGKHNNAKKFVSSMYTQHTGSRWYTPDIHVDTTDIYAYAPPVHQGLYPSVKQISVQYL